jgi:hypothetical protein
MAPSCSGQRLAARHALGVRADLEHRLYRRALRHAARAAHVVPGGAVRAVDSVFPAVDHRGWREVADQPHAGAAPGGHRRADARGYLGGVWAAVKAGMGSGLSSLIVGIQPVLTAIWLTSVGGQHVSKRQWLGLVLGFAGLVLVVSRKFGAGGPGDSANWVNLSFAVMALFAITVGTLYQKRFVQPCDVRSANTVQLLAALLVTLPLACWRPRPCAGPCPAEAGTAS